MNNKSRLLLILISSLFISALAFREGGLLLVAAPLVIYLMVGLRLMPIEMQLTAARELDATAITNGDEIEIAVTIRNHGNYLAYLRLKDSSIPMMENHIGQNEHLLSLAEGESASLHYVCRPERGIYTWAGIQAEAYDPFGLFSISKDIQAHGELVVHPSRFRIQPLTLRRQSTMSSSGPIPAGLAGSGTDYWGIREYISGDPLRRVNWRLAARYPRKLFTNEYEREEIADFGLVLDKRQLTGDLDCESDLFEYSISAAASLTERYLKDGHRVSLLLYGQPLNYVFSGSGKYQLTELRVKLASARQSAYIPLDYLDYFPGRLFSPRSLIIIFSLLDRRDLNAYASLRANGYDVLLISPDPVEYASRGDPGDEISQLALRAARIDRIAQLKCLVQMGVRVTDWQVDQPLQSAVQEAMYTSRAQNYPEGMNR